MDPVSVGTAVTGALAAGTHVLTLLKGAAENVRALGKAEVVNDLIEVQLAMMDLLQKQQELVEENRSLKTEIEHLNCLLTEKAQLEVHFDAYWRRNGAALDGPFSPQLWELQRKVVRMRYWERGRYDDGEKVRFHCPVTKENLYIPVAFLESNGVQAVVERTRE